MGEVAPRMGDRWFFFREQDDKSWVVVMVGHTDRHPPGGDEAEALDWAKMPNETEAHEWARVRCNGIPKLIYPTIN